MPIEKIKVNLSGYDHVTVCSPIWVFSLCAPMRAFCKAASGKIREADYIIVHHMKESFESAAEEMDSLLGLKHTGFKSICCREGSFKVVKGSGKETLKK